MQGKSVKRRMKRIVTLVIAGAVLSSCAPATSDVPAPVTPGQSTESDDSQQRIDDIYAVVIRRLVTKDHTFGGAPSPFKHIYIVDGAVESTGDPMRPAKKPAEPFSEGTKHGLRIKLKDLPRIDFISKPYLVRFGNQGMGGVKNEGVIITLGPIVATATK